MLLCCIPIVPGATEAWICTPPFWNWADFNKILTLTFVVKRLQTTGKSTIIGNVSGLMPGLRRTEDGQNSDEDPPGGDGWG